jgi:tetratricopeptide (TPR) repeat protein
MSNKKGRKTQQPNKKKKHPVAPKAAPPKAAKITWPDYKSPKDDFYKKVFLAASGLMIIIIILLSIKSGINGDDGYQIAYSENLVDYYTSFGENKAALNDVQIGTSKAPMQYYGGFYEVIVGGLNRIFGLTQYDAGYHHVRQIFIGFFGFLAMFFTGLFVKEIAGWRAGILALVLMFLSPRFLGHSTMNPKDIPYAAGFAISLYFLIKILKSMPKPDWKTALGFAIGVGIALGTRAGGLLVIAYAGLFAGIDFLIRYGFKGLANNTAILLKYLIYIGGASIAGYIIAILFWPAALASPIKFPIEALTEFSKIGIVIRLLFEGSNIMSDTTPWYYGPLWIVKTIPLFTLIGLLGSLAFLPTLLKKYSKVAVGLAYFAAFFPVIYIVYKDSSLHDGWRHLTFVYPPMVVIASLFWVQLEEKYSNNANFKKAVWGVLGILMFIPALFIARNSAYPYTFFNVIGGGIQGAFGNYETDYWGISCKQAIKWMEKENILDENMTDTVVIATTFHYNISRQLDPSYKDRVKVRYVRFGERYKQRWDYGVFPSRFYRGPQLRSGFWPNKKSIHSIKANGVVLTSIEKNQNQLAFQGEEALKNGNNSLAIDMFQKELQVVPDNELAWGGLMRAYLNVGNYNETVNAGNQVLKLAPENESATLMIGIAYLSKGDFNNSRMNFENNIKINPKNAIAHYYLALVYDKQNNLSEALSSALKSIEVNPRFKNGYILVGSLYQKQGDAINAERYKLAAESIK